MGIDTPSIDYGQSSDYRSHVILYSENIVGFENLTNLDRLPATGAGIVALPMNSLAAGFTSWSDGTAISCPGCTSAKASK